MAVYERLIKMNFKKCNVPVLQSDIFQYVKVKWEVGGKERIRIMEIQPWSKCAALWFR